MKRSISATALLALTILLVGLLALPAITEESGSSGTLSFAASNKMYSAEGKFEKWRFTSVDIPEGNLEQGVVILEVELASVWEKASKLADHLRAPDFFDVANFAVATIKIDRVEHVSESNYRGIATVDLHGETGELPVHFEVTSKEPLTISGSATMSRTAYGIGSPVEEGNDRSITDAVEIVFDSAVVVAE